MSILWTILIGFIAGVLAKLLTPGSNEPQGFILTTILGIVGAFVATYLGQALGWYEAGQGAGLIGATVGAVVVLLIWAAVAGAMRKPPIPLEGWKTPCRAFAQEMNLERGLCWGSKATRA